MSSLRPATLQDLRMTRVILLRGRLFCGTSSLMYTWFEGEYLNPVRNHAGVHVARAVQVLDLLEDACEGLLEETLSAKV